MKTILLYINKIADGGAERAIVNLATGLSERGYHTILVTSFRAQDEYKLGAKVERLSLEDEQISRSRLARNISRIKKLRAICKEKNPDIMISFMAEPAMRAQIATVGLRVKNIVSVRSDPDRVYVGLKGFLLGKVMLPTADGCVFQTRDAQAWFPRRLRQKSRIIYNPVAKEFYEVERKPVENKIVTCGRLCEVKNHKLLIQAFSEVLRVFPDVQLEIYGIGELEDELQLFITELEIADHARLMGNVMNVPEILSVADLFVLSSDQEGMPNALMEAMAAGVPSIATDCPCGGPRELMGDELKEMLVPVKDVQAMSKKMIELLSDTDRKCEIGTQMKRRARIFCAERVFDAWVDYIQWVSEK